MNTFEGNLKKLNGSLQLELGFTDYRLPNEMQQIDQEKYKALILGIRPEDVLISNEAEDQSIKAIIDIIEPMGREFEIHLAIGGKPIICVARTIENLKIGKEVYLTFNDKKVHIFDKNTEENIISTS